MTDTDLITSWIEQPALLKKEPASRIQDLLTRFPLFFPLRYLQVCQSDTYENAPLSHLYELYPANRVQMRQLFRQKNVPVHISEESQILEKEINFSAAGKQEYFKAQGIDVSNELPEKETIVPTVPLSQEKELMVVMSFSEWLEYLETQRRKAQDEAAGRSALRAMWQKQKLAAAFEDEEEEIPENVFEMAVNSITPQEETVSESLATVYAIQGKREKALDIYKKLSLQNPEKSAYFAKKIEDLQKDLDS